MHFDITFSINFINSSKHFKGLQKQIYRADYGKKIQSNIQPCGLFEKLTRDISQTYLDTTSLGLSQRYDESVGVAIPSPRSPGPGLEEAGRITDIPEPWQTTETDFDVAKLLDKVDVDRLMRESFQGKGDKIKI